MKLLSELKRPVLLLFETILLGPSYANFLYWTRNVEALDPTATWQFFTKSKAKFYEWVLSNYPPRFFREILRDLYFRKTPEFKDHQIGISHHYNISNSFYKLFLDKKYMFYSCADFLEKTDTLELAQDYKANYLLNLIEPNPGEKILDLGCGWGAMLKKIHDKTGDKENLYGYTLSIEQKKYIDENYGFNVEIKDFIIPEYKRESFDKIFSIGALEHVREHELLPLSKKLSDALKPNGKIIHQFFCQTDSVFPTRLMAAGFLMFPGSELTYLKKHLDIFEKANLKIIHHSIHDYRPTLKAWFDRMVENKEVAIQLVGVRNFNKYQCYLAEAWRLFNDHELMLMRLVMTRNIDEHAP